MGRVLSILEGAEGAMLVGSRSAGRKTSSMFGGARKDGAMLVGGWFCIHCEAVFGGSQVVYSDSEGG